MKNHSSRGSKPSLWVNKPGTVGVDDRGRQQLIYYLINERFALPLSPSLFPCSVYLVLNSRRGTKVPPVSQATLTTFRFHQRHTFNHFYREFGSDDRKLPNKGEVKRKEEKKVNFATVRVSFYTVWDKTKHACFMGGLWNA